jgi:hypothetical protein
MAEGYGWEEDPSDGSIIRSRTKLGQFRVWRFPRDSLDQINGKDFAGGIEHPGLYILTKESEPKAYVGESSALRKRLQDHTKNGPKELPDWTDVTVLSDGRSIYQSMLTDANQRLFLEKSIIRHLSESGLLTPVNHQTEEPKLTAAIETIASRLDEELLFVLVKLGMALPSTKKKVPTAELSRDELTRLLTGKKKRVEKIARDQWRVKGESFYFRPGTKPRKTERGWHITLRVKPRETLFQEKGGLMIPRGRGYLIPAKALKDWLGPKLWPIEAGKEAIDIYADLDEEKLWNLAGFPTLDLSKYRLS